ncbi:hypothetical protein HWD35_22720 [Tsukamurella tyrosinosolvens]|uniref:hypothetical protein n=1 Tax=Tsukamurella tyrosinosolvens TaxID=57704 RepID=UPI0007979858|nr:hypothetical protein [Tsukamurella tyrosinosolvens]KXP01989.1 hypothetical protein AXK59_21175 [Tsukamurella tyrosinosolvens]KZL95141.1 hypothetical protein AXX05_11070 [Tsukamurella tyrosinosolvens]MCA4997538.1 hypothetical protein [Tsukamurella tyrosinosolvens]
MAANPFRRLFGGEPAGSPPHQPGGGANTGLTSAFLDADRRFSSLDEDVRTLSAQNPNATAVQQWPTIRDRFGGATERYLWASGSQSGTRPPTPQDREATARELADLVAVLDRFHSDHQRALTNARGARASSAAQEQAARVAAERATDLLAAPSTAPYLTLRPVVRATDALVEAVRHLDTAPDLVARDAAARAVQEKAAELTAAVEAAPRIGDDAQRSLAAAGTRLQAVRNRASDLADTRSALLREFSAACSTDLVDNDKVAARESAAAEAALSTAALRLRESTPDLALEQVGVARDHLDTADAAVNAVGERLRTLRAAKADPAAVAARTRFALRDAQHLAVQKQQVHRWGTVLDAQHARIERAIADLDRVHPDYWQYLQTLADVDRMIADAVDRMRGRA